MNLRLDAPSYVKPYIHAWNRMCNKTLINEHDRNSSIIPLTETIKAARWEGYVQTSDKQKAICDSYPIYLNSF